METSLLKTLGQIAGIAGISIGVFFLLFRKLLEKTVAPKLSPDGWQRIVIIFMLLVWSVALAGIGAWLYAGLLTAKAESLSAKAQRYAQRVLRAQTPGEARNVLQELQVQIQTVPVDQREVYAKELAQLLINYAPDIKWDDQIRSIRQKLLTMFKDASTYTFSSYFKKKDFENMDLAGMDFSEADLNSISFSGAFLVNALFKDATLQNVSFQNTFLRGVDVLDATIEAVDFRNSDWFLAEGFRDDDIKRFASEGRLSPCPVSFEELKSFHDRHYIRVKFDDLNKEFRDQMLAHWKHYLEVIQHTQVTAVPGKLKD